MQLQKVYITEVVALCVGCIEGYKCHKAYYSYIYMYVHVGVIALIVY